MLSRPLSLATVTLLIGCLAAGSAHAQATNLEAGKSPSQIFAGTCSVCHKSPRGLLKTVGASSLPGFLRQHYTTSSDMASVLASYLVSNGATDTRYQSKQDQSKQGKDARQEAARPAGPPDQLDRFGRRIHPAPAQEAPKPDAQQQAARPDADGLGPQGEGGRTGRNARRHGRPGEAPDATNPQAAIDSKPGTRQKLSKRGKPAEDVAKPDASKPEVAKPEAGKEDAAKEDAAKGGVAKEDSSGSDTAKVDTGKPEAADGGKGEGDKAEGAKPASEEGKPETAKVDAPKETGDSEPTPLRPDPVPPVTPARATPPAETPPAESAATPTEPAAPNPPPAAASPEPPATTASAPPAPAVPAGPPAPPISR
jgi:hypothetical protein